MDSYGTLWAKALKAEDQLLFTTAWAPKANYYVKREYYCGTVVVESHEAIEKHEHWTTSLCTAIRINAITSVF